jgi:hypothetical protein
MATDLQNMKSDCTDQMRNEIEHSDAFILSAEDTTAWEDYALILTEAQRRACFKTAQKST